MDCSAWIRGVTLLAVCSLCVSGNPMVNAQPGEFRNSRAIEAPEGATVSSSASQPKITYSKETDANPGDDITLDCAVEGVDLSGLPEFKVEWFKIDPDDTLAISSGTEILLFSDKYEVLNPANTYQYSLKLSGVGEDDTGLYRCSITFAAEQKIDADVPVLIKTPAYFADEGLKRLVVEEGDAISIDCQPGGEPKPKVRWERVDGMIPYYGGKMFESNHFEVPLIDRTHRGDYRCHADNGLADPVVSVINIDVQYKPQVEVFDKRVNAVIYSKVQLMCVAGGNPVPDIAWLKEGEPILNTANLKVNSKYEETRVSSTLDILEIQAEDYGLYICSGQNTLGNTVDEAVLEKSEGLESESGLVAVVNLVTSPPLITKQTRGVHIFELADEKRGRSSIPLVIECEAQGQPSPAYTWFHNDNPLIIDQDPRMQLEPGTGTLLIEDPTPRDTGKYRCMAYNELGQARSDDIVVKNSTDIYFSSKGHENTDFQAEEGRPFHLDCPEVSGFPTPEVTWAKAYETQEGKMEMKFISSERLTVDNEGSLWFSHVEKEDDSFAGNFEYMCVAANELSPTDLSLVKSLKLAVVPPADGEINTEHVNIESFTMYTSPQEVTFTTFENNKLWCIFGGEPAPMVVWSKGDATGLKNVNVGLEDERFQFENYGSALVIRDTQPGDADQYSCMAYNGVGEEQIFTFDVKTRVAPRFRTALEEQSQVVTEGSHIAFQCGMVASDGTYEWFFNSRPLAIAEGSRRHIEGSVLRIAGVTAADTGNYACKATNEVGYAYGQAILSVVAAKDAVEGPSISGSLIRVLQEQVESLRQDIVTLKDTLDQRESEEKRTDVRLEAVLSNLVDVVAQLSTSPVREQTVVVEVEPESEPVVEVVPEAENELVLNAKPRGGMDKLEKVDGEEAPANTPLVTPTFDPVAAEQETEQVKEEVALVFPGENETPVDSEISSDTAVEETPAELAEETPAEPEVASDMAAEETPAEIDTPAEETPAESEVASDMAAEETPAEIDTPAEETPAEPEVASDMAAEETPAETDTAAEETPSEPEVTSDMAAEETPVETDPAAEETPAAPEVASDIAAEETPAETEVSSDLTAEETPAEPDTPAEETPAEPEIASDMAAEETPAETDTAAEETPAAPEVASDVAAEETPAETDTAAEETPAEPEVASDIAAEETPAETDTAAEETPAAPEVASDMAAEETQAETETAAEETPAEPEVASDMAVEETPAEPLTESDKPAEETPAKTNVESDAPAASENNPEAVETEEAPAKKNTPARRFRNEKPINIALK